MKGTGNAIYIVCDWFMRLAIGNLLWMGFTLLGAGVFGIFPASVATLALLKEWMLGRRPSPLSFFWATYRKSFWSANFVFWIGCGVLALTLFNMYISLHFQGMLFYLFISSFIFVLLGVSLTMLLSLLPLSEGEKMLTSFKQAGRLLLLYPGRLIVLCGGIFLLGMVVRLIPGLIPLYSVNLVFLFVAFLFEIGINEVVSVKEVQS